MLGVIINGEYNKRKKSLFETVFGSTNIGSAKSYNNTNNDENSSTTDNNTLAVQIKSIDTAKRISMSIINRQGYNESSKNILMTNTNNPFSIIYNTSMPADQYSETNLKQKKIE